MIAAVFDFPTYFSQSRSIKDSERATTLLLFLCVPALEIFGAFCGHTLFTQKGQAFNTLLEAAPLALLIALAAITTNICNFYSARIFLETLAPRISKINITLLLAVSGFILSLAGQHFSYAHLLAAVSAPLMILVGVFYLFLFWKKMENHRYARNIFSRFTSTCPWV